MKVLVYPHDLGIGGSQLNAIELAAAVRDRGHEVIVFGRPGALVARLEELGLEFVEAPKPGKRPSPTVARAIADLVRARGIDVVHGYEWPPALEGTLARAFGCRAAVVATVMSMAVPPFIPRSVHLIVGTEEIAAAERDSGRRRVSVLEPPVDLQHNRVGADVDVAGFRRRFGLDDARLNIVSVTRFARELKLEGTLAAIRAIGAMSAEHAVRLVLVGDGPAREEVATLAASANERFGAGTVILTGQLDDPRPAYAAADIALGMGGSALRALAFGAPLVVQGERGFWKSLSPESVDQFLWTGWYGIGEGADSGRSALEAELSPLIADPALRASRGAYGLDLVRSSFGLDKAAELQSAIYQEAVSAVDRGRIRAESSALLRYANYYVGKRLRRAFGREATDDFNARPVRAKNHDGATEQWRNDPQRLRPSPIVWFAGVGWDETIGTDRRIVQEVARLRPVVWMDPPNRGAWRGWWAGVAPAVDTIDGVTRYRVPATVGVTRWPTKYLSRALRWITFARVVRRTGAHTVVVANPLTKFPARKDDTNVLYLTDDWAAGADLMGYNADTVRSTLQYNASTADAVAVISPPLLAQVGTPQVSGRRRPEDVIPNGSPDQSADPDQSRRLPIAGLIGQLNERLDLDLLEAIADAGIDLRLVGPRADRVPAFSDRLTMLVSRPNVDWRGAVPSSDVEFHLSEIAVGLTPYAQTEFNHASSPLKTLEYLSAGVPVVSTDLPASRWLDSEHVRVARSVPEFVEAVRDAIRAPTDEAAERSRRDFARSHGWQYRAEQFLKLVDDAETCRTSPESLTLGRGARK